MLVAKRLELLHELLPQEQIFALLVNPTGPGALIDEKEAQKAAHVLGIELEVLNAANKSELEAAFREAKQKKVGGLSVDLDPFFGTIRSELIALAAMLLNSDDLVFRLPCQRGRPNRVRA